MREPAPGTEQEPWSPAVGAPGAVRALHNNQNSNLCLKSGPEFHLFSLMKYSLMKLSMSRGKRHFSLQYRAYATAFRNSR